jgi:hypothetical protein
MVEICEKGNPEPAGNRPWGSACRIDGWCSIDSESQSLRDGDDFNRFATAPFPLVRGAGCVGSSPAMGASDSVKVGIGRRIATANFAADRLWDGG